MPTDAAGLEAAVAQQGNKVRKLKASGAEKVMLLTVNVKLGLLTRGLRI